MRPVERIWEAVASSQCVERGYLGVTPQAWVWRATLVRKPLGGRVEGVNLAKRGKVARVVEKRKLEGREEVVKSEERR